MFYSKTRVIIAVLLLIGSSYWLGGCHNEEQSIDVTESYTLLNGQKIDHMLLGPDTPEKQITLTQELTLENGVTLPIGSVIGKIDNDPYSLRYKLPKGYIVTGVADASGREIAATLGSITCTCTEGGGGCSPFVGTSLGQTVTGCALGRKCKQCKGSSGARKGVINVSPDGPSIEASGMDIINLKDGIHFVTTKSELDSLKCPSSFFIATDEIQKEVYNFISGFQKDKIEEVRRAEDSADLPKEYTLIHVSVYGRVFLMPVQKSLTLSASPFLNELIVQGPSSNARMAAASCKCLSGSKGCALTKRSAFIGNVVYCDAGGCTSCKLTT